ncbi:MAG: hypothetical protein L6R38_004675 [Xanthoria sp. 2 TBL-2021]|nr:MAG: hypothetical protein L6R38_004675 [Xanthoria sp. 2 TBL-2021]
MPTVTFNSRFIIWLWMTILTLYTIITASITNDPECITFSQKYALDTFFGVTLSCLAGLSLGVWVVGGAEAPTPRNDLAMHRAMVNNAIANNGSKKDNWSESFIIHICTAVSLALIAGYMVLTRTTNHAVLVDLLKDDHTQPILASLLLVLPTLYYILTSREFKSCIDRAWREAKEKKKIMDNTTPLLSDADDAVFKVSPKTADLLTLFIGLPLALLTVYIAVLLSIKGSPETFFKEHGVLLASVLAPCFFYCSLISSSFKYCIDRFYHKMEKEKKIVNASTMTEDHGRTRTPTNQLCAHCKEVQNHATDNSIQNLASLDEMMGFDQGESLLGDHQSPSDLLDNLF